MRTLLTAGVVLVLAALTGCADDAPASSGAAVPSAAGPVTASPAPPVTPTDAGQPPESPEPATAPPPANAGPLRAMNLPAPAVLGPGWKVYADPGGAEVGFRGNGTWTRRRDPHQAAFEALPIGCANPLPDTALPVPQHALQGSYRNQRGGPAQVLVLRFANADEASAYFTGYQARMKACGSSGAAQGLTVRSSWSRPDSAAAVRSYAGAETFTEISAVRGATVALLATTTTNPAADVGWTRTTAAHLAATINR
jgi:hypothetical protein